MIRSEEGGHYVIREVGVNPHGWPVVVFNDRGDAVLAVRALKSVEKG